MKKLFLCLIILMYSGISFAEEGKESAFDRILRTQTIRCGYVVYPPSIIKDPNTGRLSGIFYDITEKMGERLNLKIEWTEEVVFPTMIGL
jgi:ABC-type amino acid transport substrate-binding protein